MRLQPQQIRNTVWDYGTCRSATLSETTTSSDLQRGLRLRQRSATILPETMASADPQHRLRLRPQHTRPNVCDYGTTASAELHHWLKLQPQQILNTVWDYSLSRSAIHTVWDYSLSRSATLSETIYCLTALTDLQHCLRLHPQQICNWNKPYLRQRPQKIWNTNWDYGLSISATLPQTTASAGRALKFFICS